jgi:SAM-dependent methyltransferase
MWFKFRKVATAIKEPRLAYLFALWRLRTAFAWKSRYERLREPKTGSYAPQSPKIHREIEDELRRYGFRVDGLRIDVNGYKVYLERARYSRFPRYYPFETEAFAEKSLEHYLAAVLLDLSMDDVYIDIANANSPTPEIYHELFGCETYRQDLIFPEGIHGRTIGGNAARMPVEDGFASKMALHCSFEHFEGDSDIEFIREVNRVLKKGGRVCILPLYLFTEYAIQTDPACVLPKDIQFEGDARIFAAKGWGNRHGRFYDISHLLARIRDNLDGLDLTIYSVTNEKDIDKSCWLKFIALLEKR